MPQVINYPGTYINEIDNSLASEPSYGSYAATMGRARKGIANAKVLVNSPSQLINTFGAPIVSGSYPLVSAIDYGIYGALQCLNETSNLWFVRLTDGTEKYSGCFTNTSSDGSVSAERTSAYIDSQYTNGNTFSDIKELRAADVAPTSGLRFNAVGPGKYGDNYAISITTTATANVDWMNVYDNDPADVNAKWRKIFKVSVFTKADNESWTLVSAKASPEEIYYCSTDYTLVDNNGSSLFVEDIINGRSQYVYVKSGITDGTAPSQIAVKPLTGGADSTSTATAVDPTHTAWSFFSNKETSPVNVAVVTPKVKDAGTEQTQVAAIGSVLKERYDFISVVQIGALSDYKETLLTATNTNFAIVTDPSYYAKYVGWTLVYDTYNASRVYLPNCLFAAAVMLRTDRVSNPWEAPAGIERGLIPTGKQNIEITPSVGGRLYDLNLNTIKYINGTGNVIWGQKTAQLKNTARNRVNVRRALIYIEQSVSKILNNFLFRGNTVKERERATSMVNSFMQGVSAGGGVQSYKIVCDASNNSLSSNTLVVDLYIQPTYTIEFIKLNTVISSNSVATTEI